MSATPAITALQRAGIAHTLHRYHHDPGNDHFGDEAVAALGFDPERVFKTLIVDHREGRPGLAVAVVPVAGRLDVKALAEFLTVKRLELADPALAARTSGYLIGGISPIGQKLALPTVIEETAQLHDTVFVSAGRRGQQVELDPFDLARITGADFAAITR